MDHAKMQGGAKTFEKVPTEVPIFNEWNLDGKVNVYDDIDKYLKVWRKM